MSTPALTPHAPAIELSVLGAMLQDAEAAQLAAATLRETDFFLQNNKLIFRAAAGLQREAIRPDYLLVVQALTQQGHLEAVGGASAIVGLVDAVPTAANVRQHIATVRHYAQLRAIAGACDTARARALGNGTDPGAIVADLQAALQGLDTPDLGPGPVVVTLDTIQAEEVEWLWPGRLPLGKLALVVGDPGLGKSFLTLDLACRVSRGRTWPDGAAGIFGDVVLLGAEDGLADTVRRRVDALDGNPARIHALMGVGSQERPSAFTLAEDLEQLERVVKRVQAALVVIDPLSAYLGGADSHKDSDVRGLLAPLAAMADRHRVTVLGVVHMNKGQARQALYRAQGSLAFVAAARAVYGVAEDLETPGQRLFLPMKMNLAPKPPTLAFRIDGGRLTWMEGAQDVDANQAMAGEQAEGDRTERADAKDFLRQVLADGPVLAIEVKRQAREALIAERTLMRAKSDLKVGAVKRSFRDGWAWDLPPNAATINPPWQSGILRHSSGQVASLQECHSREECHEEGHHSEPVASFVQPHIQQQLTTTTTLKNTKDATEK